MITKKLIYGIVNDNLILLPEEVAVAASHDFQTIFGQTTWGEARRLETEYFEVPGLEDNDELAPEDPEDEEEVELARLDGWHSDDDPYDIDTLNVVENGDFPPSAATIALDVLPDDLEDIGEQVEHFPSSPTLYIDPATEVELVEKLRERGYEVRRDDALVNW